MKLIPIKANMTELQVNDMLILFSYQTPVAVIFPQGHAYTTEKKWSRTTTRHINQWLVSQPTFHVRTSRSQEFFDNLASEVK